jgi:signal transduction histidine kinase
LDNAIDACEQRGSVTLRTYAAENSLQQRQDVVIECADSGAGIEAEILPKVFELFVTTKAPGKGTGMGLVICQEIVRAHGGDINIKSDPTTGTVVTVFLPVNVNSQSAADIEERHAHSHTDS